MNCLKEIVVKQNERNIIGNQLYIFSIYLLINLYVRSDQSTELAIFDLNFFPNFDGSIN